MRSARPDARRTAPSENTCIHTLIPPLRGHAFWVVSGSHACQHVATRTDSDGSRSAPPDRCGLPSPRLPPCISIPSPSCHQEAYTHAWSQNGASVTASDHATPCPHARGLTSPPTSTSEKLINICIHKHCFISRIRICRII